MNSLKVLDVTLRDGGCVNDFNFGQAYIESILYAQEAAGIDIIEMGYIDEKNGSVSGRTQYKNEQVIPKFLLNHKKSDTIYVAMMDYGKFNVDSIAPRTDDGIDGIRMAFHKKNRLDMIPLGRKLIDKGYKFYIQPMITLRYSDAELIELIDLVNQELPDASGFYIVDSFGEMRPNDMSRILNLVDHNLIPTMPLGFHSHNNLQLSYSNAMAMLQFPTTRDLMLDCSIMGMGKGAGNLNTELLLEHLNLFYGKNYKIAPLLEVIDKVINQLHDEFYWGYAPEYYLSSANHCTPSYASHFYNKHMLSIDQVGELLSMIAEDKKISFDRAYADQLYFEFNAIRYNDARTVDTIREAVKNKKVMLIAPGRSIAGYVKEIREIASQENVVTIAVNNVPPVDVDYCFATKELVFEKAVNASVRIITTSNISTDEKYMVINYGSWTEGPDGKSDAGLIMIGNLLKKAGVYTLLLAGFDGFRIDSDLNYFDESLKRPMSRRKVEERNHRMEEYLIMMSKSMDIKFVTPTLYKIPENQSGGGTANYIK